MVKIKPNHFLLPTSFNTKIIKESDNGLIIRATCKNEEEIKAWIAEYEATSKTNWIVEYSLNKPER
jgi:hypothetical protein